MSHVAEVVLKVIGIGSPFGGDTVGWQAIEQLRSNCDWFPATTEWQILDRPGSGLVPLLENSKTVVLIDAMQSGQPPGTVTRLQLPDLLAQASHPSSHSLGVAEALALAEALNTLPRELIIYGIEMGAESEEWYPSLLEFIEEDLFRTRSKMKS
jgi:hydrogenase maturation protease